MADAVVAHPSKAFSFVGHPQMHIQCGACHGSKLVPVKRTVPGRDRSVECWKCKNGWEVIGVGRRADGVIEVSGAEPDNSRGPDTYRLPSGRELRAVAQGPSGVRIEHEVKPRWPIRFLDDPQARAIGAEEAGADGDPK